MSSDKAKCHPSLKVNGKKAPLSPTARPSRRKIPVSRIFFTCLLDSRLKNSSPQVPSQSSQ